MRPKTLGRRLHGVHNRLVHLEASRGALLDEFKAASKLESEYLARLVERISGELSDKIGELRREMLSRPLALPGFWARVCWLFSGK